MSKQDGKQSSVLQPPTTCDPEAWKSYWKILGQPWRTEPEIDSKRQEELAQRRPIVFSLTSFHGRGFFPGLGVSASLHSPLVVLAAVEAVVGLLIEISFIATFTQRFFGR
jgi:hypothetical protein